MHRMRIVYMYVTFVVWWLLLTLKRITLNAEHARIKHVYLLFIFHMPVSYSSKNWWPWTLLLVCLSMHKRKEIDYFHIPTLFFFFYKHFPSPLFLFLLALVSFYQQQQIILYNNKLHQNFIFFSSLLSTFTQHFQFTSRTFHF